MHVVRKGRSMVSWQEGVGKNSVSGEDTCAKSGYIRPGTISVVHKVSDKMLQDTHTVLIVLRGLTDWVRSRK